MESLVLPTSLTFNKNLWISQDRRKKTQAPLPRTTPSPARQWPSAADRRGFNPTATIELQPAVPAIPDERPRNRSSAGLLQQNGNRRPLPRHSSPCPGKQKLRPECRRCQAWRKVRSHFRHDGTPRTERDRVLPETPFAVLQGKRQVTALRNNWQEHSRTAGGSMRSRASIQGHPDPARSAASPIGRN